MQHKCVQVRRGGGGAKKICLGFFANFIFAKVMRLKINIVVSFFFAVKQHLVLGIN